MKKKMFSILAVGCWISLPLVADNRATGRVTCRVIDETGAPVPGASVFISDETSVKGYRGLTDDDGLYSCRMRKIYPPIGGSVRKKGYYKTQGEFWNGGFGIVPAETLKITIKRIIDPVPMERKYDLDLYFPVLQEAIGFDFEVGDWVSPYGKGKIVDVFITGTYEENKEQETFVFAATLSVTKKPDGFIPFQVVRRSSDTPAHSALQVPLAAQDTDYLSSIIAQRRKHIANGVNRYDTYDTGIDYYFRVRTVVDSQGEVASANVGWFCDGIKMTRNAEYNPDNPATRLRITLSYYWNPDPTSRSLEPKEIADRQGID